IPRLDSVSVDGTVVAFTIGIALVTGILFGLVPAFSATRLSNALKEGGRGAVGARASNRLRGTLVVAELALAVMLPGGAGSAASQLHEGAGRRSRVQAGVGADVRPDAARCALSGRRAARRVLRSAAAAPARAARRARRVVGARAAVERPRSDHLVRGER